jgi:hypothetical protein
LIFLRIPILLFHLCIVIVIIVIIVIIILIAVRILPFNVLLGGSQVLHGNGLSTLWTSDSLCGGDQAAKPVADTL